ncbi:family 16 glycoside hydrolase [Candidatus Accumulibacter sp. ACC003]|jgi:choline dehydrogenase-like flavoprotein|uniref:family 16 glycoside hydrolase n=1 Tax=Candidatus Accumulibacter sp. ACC003 TaxID=2823334 RepID=UPI0025C189D1|nr:family 16 glycoside hydrolase [Candidatus Accumulibacter sp. ACC003]
MPLMSESTTFTRDVLGRYHNNTWDEATSSPEGIDVVVLGAGMYGGYCAAKIYDLTERKFGNKLKALRVLVLEAGPFLIPEHAQNLPNLGLNVPGGTEYVGAGANPQVRDEVWGIGWRSNQKFVGQAYCVGGKGVFWGGWCPRLQAKDLQQWPDEVSAYLMTVNAREPVGLRPIAHDDPVTGTELCRGEPLSGYETIEYEIGVVPADDFIFDPVEICGEDEKKVGLNKALRFFLDQKKATIDARITQVLPSPIAVQTQSFISGLFSPDKYSSVPELTAAIREDHGDGRESDLRIALVPNCHVVRLGFRADNEAPERGTRVINRIDVRVGNADRSLFIAPHCQVVLAMSAIESTRLALESFSLEGSGLRAPGDELMGRNFMFHHRFDISFDVDRAQFANWVRVQWPGFELAEELQLAALHIQCDGKFGRYQYQFYAATNADGPDRNLYKMVPDLGIQQQIADGFQSDKIRIVLRSSGEVSGGRGSPLRDANFDYIDLAGANDSDGEFGHARAWVQFNRGDHTNAEIWQDMHDTGHAIARSLASGRGPDYRMGDFTLGTLSKTQGVGTTFHDAGTLWMGDDPDSSVTDVNGHFHHVSNAYCCDQALFPTVGSANPVLTGVALARKVAADIVARHAGYTGPIGLSGLTAQSLLESAGWRQAPYAGMIVLDSANNGLLATNPTKGIGLYYLPVTFGNFELAIEWKAFRSFQGTDAMANSGILLRTPDPSAVNFADQAQFNAFYEASTEVQIDETGKQYFADTGRSIFGNSRYKTGALYGTAPAQQWAANVASPDAPDLGNRYWNTFEISARGPRIRVVLNGKLVCEADLPAGKRASGFLGLQFHSGRVQFRNLRIKPLP